MCTLVYMYDHHHYLPIYYYIGGIQKEANHINKSLSFLEHVVLALTKNKKERMHIPYRSSKLTYLLKDSLGVYIYTFNYMYIHALIQSSYIYSYIYPYMHTYIYILILTFALICCSFILYLITILYIYIYIYVA